MVLTVAVVVLTVAVVVLTVAVVVVTVAVVVVTVTVTHAIHVQRYLYLVIKLFALPNNIKNNCIFHVFRKA